MRVLALAARWRHAQATVDDASVGIRLGEAGLDAVLRSEWGKHKVLTALHEPFFLCRQPEPQPGS